MFGNKSNAVAFTKSALAYLHAVYAVENGHQCHCRRSSPLSQTVRFMTQYLSLWAITFHNKVTGDVSTILEMATTE